MRAELLTQRLSGRWHGRYGTARCPAHHDTNPSLSIKDGGEGRLLLFCHAGCSYAEIISALGGEPSRSAVARGTATGIENEIRGRGLHQLIDLIWRETVSIEGSLGEAYLRGRSIRGPFSKELRFHRCLRHPSGQRLSAIVARVQTVGHAAVALHRTYLATDGGKTDQPIRKAMLGPCRSGAVRLREGAAGLVVAEGIETALSLAMGLEGEFAVWAALSAPGMRSLKLPASLAHGGSLIIGCDGDEPGRSAGRCLADTATRCGWKVELISAPDGKDFNDLVAGGANG